MIGLDTSFLVAWAITEHPNHTPCRRLATEAIQNGHSFGLTTGIIAEFIHVVTDPRRFAKPLAMANAMVFADFWSRAAEVTLLPQSAGTSATWIDWLQRHRLGRKHLLDTLIAATWHTASITLVYTLNPADFEIFEAFTFVPELNRI